MNPSLPEHTIPSPNMGVAAPASPGRSRKTILLGLLLVTMTISAYLPALWAGFIWDDPEYVTKNKLLADPAGLTKIWTQPRSSPQYYPLVFTSFRIEHHFWGYQPFGYHLVNVLLHTANAILLWRLLVFLGMPGAWLAAAFFALHPVQVESVAWITERKNVLSGFCYLASISCLLRALARVVHTSAAAQSPSSGDSSSVGLHDAGSTTHAQPSVGRLTIQAPSSPMVPRPRLYAASLLLFLLALLSKSVTATLPAVCLVILWWRQGRVTRRDLIPLAPFFILGAAFGLHTAWLEKVHVGAQGAEWHFSFAERTIIAGRVVWFYLGKLLVPHPLIFVYPRWTISASDPKQWLFPAMPLLLAAILIRKKNAWGRGSAAAFAIQVVTLAPVLGFLDVYPMRFSFVADHFQYLAAAAPLAIAACAATSIFAAGGRIRRGTGLFLGALLLGLLSLLTWQRCPAFTDEETVWRDTLSKNPQATIAIYNLAWLVSRRGGYEEAEKLYRSALAAAKLYRSARAQEPSEAAITADLAATIMLAGRGAEAEAMVRAALLQHPDNVELLRRLGNILLARHRNEESVGFYMRAALLDGSNADLLTEFGAALEQSGRLVEAVEVLRNVLDLDPGRIESRVKLGIALASLGRFDEGRSELRRALEQSPEDARIHFNLGVLAANAGDRVAAERHFLEARRLDPSYILAREGLRRLRTPEARP